MTVPSCTHKQSQGSNAVRDRAAARSKQQQQLTYVCGKVKAGGGRTGKAAMPHRLEQDLCLGPRFVAQLLLQQLDGNGKATWKHMHTQCAAGEGGRQQHQEHGHNGAHTRFA